MFLKTTEETFEALLKPGLNQKYQKRKCVFITQKPRSLSARFSQLRQILCDFLQKLGEKGWKAQKSVRG
jgi:predicted transcriptional regulator